MKSLIRGQDSNEAELKLGQHKNCVFLEQTSHVYRKEQAEIPWASVQNLVSRKTFHMKMSLIFVKIHLLGKHIFT